VVATFTPPNRKRDYSLPRSLVAGDVHGRRTRTGKSRPGARMAARGWAKTLQDHGRRRQRALIGHGVDPIRYYLLRETSLGNDGDFSLEGITARYNTDLANNLGNLVARVAAVVGSKCEGVAPNPYLNSTLRQSAETAIREASEGWNRFSPQAGLEATWGLIGDTNAYLETHAPWKMEPGEEVEVVLGDALEAIRIVAVLISPAMPSVAQEIWQRIGLEGQVAGELFAARASWGQFQGGHQIEKGTPLFPRIAE
jgi:methionyl-tRNA synthetase